MRNALCPFRSWPNNLEGHILKDIKVRRFAHKTSSSPVMAKRAREKSDVDGREEKRQRSSSVDRFSGLSDELILRVFSCLPVSQLVVCERYVTERAQQYSMTRC